MSKAAVRYGAAVLRRVLLLLLGGVCVACPILATGASSAAAMGATSGSASAVEDQGVAGSPVEGQGASSSAVNDQGASSNYRSNITSVTPGGPGLDVQVLEFADRLLLTNHTGRTVTIYGYDGEPFARVLADGTVERNARSPATYLNASFYGDINVPAVANASAPPRWEVLDRTGQFEWHDHRIHYTSPAVPPEVKDRSRRTLIFDWKVPISVATSRGAIDGQLFWTPESSKTPLAAIILGAAITVGGLLFVLFVRRRRARGVAAGDGDGGIGGSTGEAW